MDVHQASLVDSSIGETGSCDQTMLDVGVDSVASTGAELDASVEEIQSGKSNMVVDPPASPTPSVEKQDAVAAIESDNNEVVLDTVENSMPFTEKKDLVSVGEYELGKNNLVLSGVEHSTAPIEEKYLSANSVGENDPGKNNVAVGPVENSTPEPDMTLDSLDKTESVKNNVVVDPVENLMAVDATSVGDKLGKNDMVVDTVENLMAFVEKNDIAANSLDDELGKNKIIVDPVESSMFSAEKKDMSLNSVGEIKSGTNNVVVDPADNSTSSFDKKEVGVDLVSKGNLNENNLLIDANGLESSMAFVQEETTVAMSSNRVENMMTSVGDKREADSGIGSDLRSYKKAKTIKTSRDIKRVAEIVLVLSSLGNMRGGRSPTSAEKEIMAQAREKLVGLCKEMAPKDLVPRDALTVVIEDLGLNRPKDQRLSFRPPMMSIKEKLQLNKRKMEESQKFAPQMLQGGFGAKDESRGAFVHTSQKFPPDTSGQSVVATRGFTTPSSVFHVNEMQPTMVSRGTSSSHLEGDASSIPVARTEPMHFRLEGRSNVPTYTSQVRANSSGDHLLGKTPVGAPQHQLGAVPSVGLANQLPDLKVEGTPVVGSSQIATLNARDRSSNQSVAEPAYKIPQAAQSSNVTHNEIAKSVQRFLHPSLPEHPSWTPPSTDYMNKTLTCQACKGQVNDVESLLVCDACEKGNHIKCLESYNQRGIPKGEWHCPNCLLQSHGKPLPPKYGRVTRNNSLAKVASNAGGFQSSAERKVETSDQKENHQKATGNGNHGSLHPAHIGTGNIHTGTGNDLNMSNAREVQISSSAASRVKMDNGPLSECKPPTKDMTGLACALSSGRLNDSSNKQLQLHEPFSCKPEVSVPDPESNPNGETTVSSLNKTSEAVIETYHNLQIPCSSQDVGKSLLPKLAQISSDHYNDVAMHESRETYECKPRIDVRKDGQDAAQTVSLGNIGVGNGARDCLKSSLDGLHSVDWVGDILQVVDEKAFYNSCHINGMVYQLHDHALFHSNNGNLRPSKLQALWEDTKTGSKWAIVNSCYFPADLPEVVGRPCSPEDNEVYESNHGSTVRAGLVQGPCEVLPPKKFKEETERRIHSDSGTPPVFLCKWFYDESKGLFRPVTD